MNCSRCGGSGLTMAVVCGCCGEPTFAPAHGSARWVMWQKSPKKSIKVRFHGMHKKHPHTAKIYQPGIGRRLVLATELREMEAPNTH